MKKARESPTVPALLLGGMMIVNVADLKDPNVPEGRTYRQVNAARQHQIAIGSLVELKTGARLFVAMHTRDCDQTPLYSLSPERDDWDNPGFPLYKPWVHGYGEESLQVIMEPLQVIEKHTQIEGEDSA